MRDRRRTPAGGVQAEKQLRYVRLIAQGVNNSEACRLVGINRNGQQVALWAVGAQHRRGARAHYPPVKIIARKDAQSAVLVRARADRDR